ncbi:hypothetical Protein YC6258_01586 [Gynuella sunshinyii YC6258]|uniref:Uncharacterized protein n=1 Tax=Gynuella sunshinyii YC6258 TaxID=1445510 RepID=A0A0C5VTJ0_9GAMM|nr:hypothetical Protein YC6258_01586 [Gynuella sunshinyii YC6258]
MDMPYERLPGAWTAKLSKQSWENNNNNGNRQANMPAPDNSLNHTLKRLEPISKTDCVSAQ